MRTLVGVMLLVALGLGVLWVISVSESIENTPVAGDRSPVLSISNGTYVPSSSTSSTRYHGGDYLNLHGRVVFTGFEFEVTNRDDFTWLNVELDLNGSLWSSGYVYKVARIPPGTWHIDVSNFAKRNGEIFNPFSMKPLRMAISTYLSDGTMTGFGAIEW